MISFIICPFSAQNLIVACLSLPLDSSTSSSLISEFFEFHVTLATYDQSVIFKLFFNVSFHLSMILHPSNPDVL
ncbi:hypothetical protein BRARA_F03478 [Brassica rapa]|uniref:Uncharacterized protein n=1 Tax=Brassica campestris TaxID=3711 RepID=A0A397Z7W9_BRACM|nr:hypothetical protein BRARA_F03478 [Brassica rapa]